MRVDKCTTIDFMIDILLILAMFEKIQYSVFKLFDLLAIVFVMVVGLILLRDKVLIRDNNIKIFTLAKLALLFLYVLQGSIVLIDGSADIFDQYYKGILTSGIMNTFVVFCTTIYLSVYYKTGIEQLLIKFAKIGGINIIYNVIQYFNRNIDDTIFIRILHSSVSRYGTDAYGAGVGRLTGLFTDSNNNAAFLLIYFIVIYILIKDSIGKKRFFLNCLLVLSGLELILTYSRTGWLGLAFCIVFIMFKEGLFKNIKLVLLIIVGFALGIYAYQNSFVFNQVMTARLSGLNGENSHLEAARNVLGIIQQSPIYLLIGVGVNCLSVHYEALYGRVGMKAHSLYLQVLCEEGIVGLILTLIFWGMLFYMTYKVAMCEKKLYGLPIIVATFLVMNLTYDSAFQPIYFWILTLAIIAYREKVLDVKTNLLVN
ncbi:O-Antigen ligase [Lachnospiraceae bacterium RM5]|nr:O-Antigen ligase [Lachnospiraceae bacterium RM5]